MVIMSSVLILFWSTCCHQSLVTTEFSNPFDELGTQLNISCADLRDDEQFFMDHAGAVPISSAQVNTLIFKS